MKNRFGKRLQAMTITVLATGLLAGCGGGQGSEAGKDGKTEIEFFQQKPEAVDTYNEIIAKFEAANPDIKVKQNNVPDAGKVLQIRMSSNDIPDVLSAYPNAAEFKVYVEEGYLLDLTGEQALSNVNADVLDSVKLDGKDYSMPLSLNTIGVFYNQQMFEELGIEVPQTYSDFISAAEKIKAAGKIAIALSDKDDWTAGILANELTGMVMGKAKADQFFADLIEGKGSAADSPEMNVVADKLLELRQYGPADASATGVDQAVNLFATGKAAMLINGIWMNPSVLKANPDLKYSMFPFPADKAEDTKVIYGIDSAVSVAASTKNKEASLKFVEFLGKPETAQLLADMDKSPSVINGVTMNFEPVQGLAKLLNEGKSFEWNHFKWPAGMEGQFNKETQVLVVVKDKAVFFKNLDQAFKNSKK